MARGEGSTQGLTTQRVSVLQGPRDACVDHGGRQSQWHADCAAAYCKTICSRLRCYQCNLRIRLFCSSVKETSSIEFTATPNELESFSTRADMLSPL